MVKMDVEVYSSGGGSGRGYRVDERPEVNVDELDFPIDLPNRFFRGQKLSQVHPHMSPVSVWHKGNVKVYSVGDDQNRGLETAMAKCVMPGCGEVVRLVRQMR